MKYCKELTNEIAKYLEEGLGRVDACVLANINFDTFNEWMKNKSEFSVIIKAAETKCKRRNIVIVQKAAINTWQAAAWMLERKYKEEFALKNFTELSGNTNTNITVSTKEIADKVANFLSELEKKKESESVKS